MMWTGESPDWYTGRAIMTGLQERACAMYLARRSNDDITPLPIPLPQGERGVGGKSLLRLDRVRGTNLNEVFTPSPPPPPPRGGGGGEENLIRICYVLFSVKHP